MGFGAGAGFGGGSGSSSPPAPPEPPDTLSDAIYWLNVDNLTHGGDNSEITAAEDQASTNAIVKATAGGPIYREDAFGGGPCLEIGTNRGLMTSGTGNPVVSFLNGAAAATKEFSVIKCWQPRHHLVTMPFSFCKSTASSRHLTYRCNSNAYKPQTIGGTSSGAQSTLDAPVTWDHPIWRISSFRRSGALAKHRDDGANMADVSWNWVGNYDVDAFGIGVQVNPSPVFGNAAWMTDLLVFNRALTDDEILAWEEYLAEIRFPVIYKDNHGAIGDWLIIAMLGQSNMGGGCAGTQTYSFSASNAYMMGLDGVVKDLSEPSHDATNKASPSIAYGSFAIGASMAGEHAERMRALGETRKLLYVTAALGNSDSVLWQTGLTTNPPSINDLVGYAKHRIGDALKAPGASLVVMVDQGEANCDNATEAANWQTHWNAICEELNTYFSGKYDKTIHFTFGRLSEQISGVGAFAANVRTSEDALDAARADMQLIQRPKGTCEGDPGLHLTATEQQAYGILMADAVYNA